MNRALMRMAADYARRADRYVSGVAVSAYDSDYRSAAFNYHRPTTGCAVAAAVSLDIFNNGPKCFRARTRLLYDGKYLHPLH